MWYTTVPEVVRPPPLAFTAQCSHIRVLCLQPIPSAASGIDSAAFPAVIVHSALSWGAWPRTPDP